MSKAEPMPGWERQAIYAEQNRPGYAFLGVFTPRQRRRMIHKANRNERLGAMAWQDFAKNRPTPRQRRPRRG